MIEYKIRYEPISDSKYGHSFDFYIVWYDKFKWEDVYKEEVRNTRTYETDIKYFKFYENV